MPLSLDQFVAQLSSGGLVSAEEAARWRAEMNPHDAEAFARELVRQKKLTPFQAQQCFAGKGKSLVLGNYVVLDKLGQGGMGLVLKAQHKRMKRVVALKVLSPSVARSKELIARFQREVEAAAKLTHPNIVAAFDADEAQGTYFLVMEYVDGKDLSSVVKSTGPLQLDQAIRCLLQAARGLEFAHKNGVIHRDIKPANLLLDTEGTVKILDMGLARIEGDTPGKAELTSTGAVMGTVDYMAPEQALSTKHADARSDIYSLGITLWYLLVGKPVFEGDSLMARLIAHREFPPPSLRQARGEVPAGLEVLFQRMLAKKPGDRPQSMAEVVAALEAIQRGDSSTILKAPTAPGEDAQLHSFLSNLGTSDSSQTLITPQTAPSLAATRVESVSSQAEVTVTSGDQDAPTDPVTQTRLSVGEQWRRRVGSGTGVAGGIPAWLRDRRVQGAMGAAVLALVVALMISGRGSTPVDSNVAAAATTEGNPSSSVAPSEESVGVGARAPGTTTSPSTEQPQVASGEWIDVIPLIDPELDRYPLAGQTGANDWRKQNNALRVGTADDQAAHLVFPLDLNGPAVEVEVEFTRVAGSGGFNLGIPCAEGVCPVVFDQTPPGRVALSRGNLELGDCRIETGQRAKARFSVTQSGGEDQVTTWYNDVETGRWTGRRDAVSVPVPMVEGRAYPTDRRTGLLTHGGEFVFHRIRLRMLNGGTAAPLGAAPPQSLDREVAEWAIRRGGRVWWFGLPQEIGQLSDLPATPFQIRTLLLSGCQLQDADLQRVAQLPNLGHLALHMTGISDVGLQHLAGHPSLSVLQPFGCPVTDASIPVLATLPLKSVNLGRSQVSGRGIAELAQARPDIESWHIGELPSVTDETLRQLARLPRIVELDVRRTSVTRAGLEEVLAAHPQVQLQSDFTLPSSANAVPLAPTVDLLGRIDNALDLLQFNTESQTWTPGGWTSVGNVRQSSGDGRCLLRSALEPPASYRVTVEATPRPSASPEAAGGHAGGLWVLLPVGSTQCYFTANGFVQDGKALAAFGYVDAMGEGQNETTRPHAPFTLGQPVRIDVDVAVEGDEADLVALIDGVEVTRFRGSLSRLSIPEHFSRLYDGGPATFGVGTTSGAFEVRRLKLQDRSQIPLAGLDFEASRGHVELPLALTQETPVTVELWVTPHRADNERTSRPLWHAGGIELKQYGNAWNLIGPAQGAASFQDRLIVSQEPVTPGRLTHLAAVFSHERLALYVDGRLQGHKDYNALPTFDQPMFFGSARYFPGEGGVEGYEPFRGTLHAARLSQGSRPEAELPLEVNFVPDQITWAMYRFDVETDGVVPDLSSGGHHGRIINQTEAAARSDAAVIAWVRSLGGLVRGAAGGVYQTVTADQPLPEGEFQLHVIGLESASVRDADLSRLDQLPDLGVLTLNQAPVTVEGIKRLGQLPRLNALYLGGPGLDDAALAEVVRKFPQLEILHFGESRVTDEGIAVLQGCPNLRSLSLYKTSLTDSAVEELSGLLMLRTLVVSSTSMTQAGVDRLHAALPRCRITWNGGEISPENYALDLSKNGEETPPCVLLPMKLSLTEPFTVECRVMARSLAHPREHRNVWHNRGCWELKQYGDRWYWAANGQNPVAYNIARSDVAITPGAPAYLAGVFTGTELLLFVNGKLSARAEFDLQFAGEASQPLLGLGRKFDSRKPEEGGYGCFDGTVDEVRISSIARYTSDYVPSAELAVDGDTIALYHCDEAEGVQLRDQSRSHHGRVINVRWVRVDDLAPEANENE